MYTNLCRKNAQLIIRIRGKVMYLIKLKIYFYSAIKRIAGVEKWFSIVVWSQKMRKNKTNYVLVALFGCEMNLRGVLGPIIHNSIRFLFGFAPWKSIFINHDFNHKWMIFAHVLIACSSHLFMVWAHSRND